MPAIKSGQQFFALSDDINTPMDYLRAYQSLNREIDSLCAELDRLRVLSVKTGSPTNLSGIRSSFNSSGASYERVVDKLIDLQDEINKKIDSLVDMRSQANKIIDSVDERSLRQLLRLRYICGWSWDKIAAKMNYSVRHVMGYMHREAVKKVNTL